VVEGQDYIEIVALLRGVLTAVVVVAATDGRVGEAGPVVVRAVVASVRQRILQFAVTAPTRARTARTVSDASMTGGMIEKGSSSPFVIADSSRRHRR